MGCTNPIGIDGNEQADQLAKLVACGAWDGDMVTEPTDNQHFSKIWWLRCKDNSMYVNDLIVAVKKAASKHAARGYAKQTLYCAGWEAEAPNLCAKSSHPLHTDGKLPWAAMRTATLMRHGALWNAKRAAMCKRPLVVKGPPGRPISDGKCPACGQEDGVGHIMGGCTHPRMHAAYISRQNKAVQIVAKAISKGPQGGCYMTMDACSASNKPAHVAATRLPAWLFAGLTPKQQAYGVLKRPDLLVIPTISLRDGKSGNMPCTFIARQKHKVYVIEAGYTNDTLHDQKEEVKAQQHADLESLLFRAGWDVEYGTSETLTLGRGGSIRSSLPYLLRQKLGLSPKQTRRCCNKLHSHTVTSAHSIVCLRRELEQTTGTRQPRPGEPPR